MCFGQVFKPGSVPEPFNSWTPQPGDPQLFTTPELLWPHQYLFSISDQGSRKETWLSVCLLRDWHLHLYIPCQWGTQASQYRFLSHPARNPSAIENAVNTFSHKLVVQEAAVPIPHSSMALCTSNKKEAFRWKWQIRTPTSTSRCSLQNLFFKGMKRHPSIKSPLFP